MARKHVSKAVWVITVTNQRYSNIKNNCMKFANVTIRLPNTQIDVHLEARPQGSTYILDDTHAMRYAATQVAVPRLVQLDGWHEGTHPYYWSQKFFYGTRIF